MSYISLLEQFRAEKNMVVVLASPVVAEQAVIKALFRSFDVVIPSDVYEEILLLQGSALFGSIAKAQLQVIKRSRCSVDSVPLRFWYEDHSTLRCAGITYIFIAPNTVYAAQLADLLSDGDYILCGDSLASAREFRRMCSRMNRCVSVDDDDSLPCAPPGIGDEILMVGSDLVTHKVRLSNVLSAGGEAVIYEVKGRSDILAKIYRSPSRKRRIRVDKLMELYGSSSLAKLGSFPIATAFCGSSFVGIFVPRFSGTSMRDTYRTGKLTREHLAQLFLRGLESNLLGIILCDLHETNVVVSKNDVLLCDLDSVQVAGTPSSAYRADMLSPRLDRTALDRTLRQPRDDIFALAVIAFTYFMDGTHPLRQIYATDSDPRKDTDWEHYSFPYSIHGEAGRVPSDLNAMWMNNLTHHARALFYATFSSGQATSIGELLEII